MRCLAVRPGATHGRHGTQAITTTDLATKLMIARCAPATSLLLCQPVMSTFDQIANCLAVIKKRLAVIKDARGSGLNCEISFAYVDGTNVRTDLL